MTRISLLLFVSLTFSVFSQSDFSVKMKLANEVYYSSPDSAYKICLSIKESKISKKELADLSLFKAKCLLVMTDYISCEKVLLLAERIYRKSNDKEGLAISLSLKSILAERLGNQNESRRLLLESYSINKKSGNVNLLFSNLTNISNFYLDELKNDSVKPYLDELTTYKSQFTPTQYYYYHQNWGRYYQNVGMFDSAEVHLFKGLKVAEEQNMVDSKATMLYNLSNFYKTTGLLGKAMQFGKQSLEYSRQNKLLFEASDALSLLIELAEKTGDYRSAYQYQKDFITVQDSLINIEKLDNIKQVKFQMDLADKEKEIANEKVLSAQADLDKKNAQSQKNFVLLLLLGVIAVLFTLAFAFFKNKKLYAIIHRQKELVDEKNQVISDALKDIDASLTYSHFIQNALLPSPDELNVFRDSFILYRPKEKVSGDFYWMYRDEEQLYFCVADCTGHGVPGALVSVVGINALNSVVKELKITEPGKILDKVSELVRGSLSSSQRNVKDGMDLAFCKLDMRTKTLSFAGANNPLYIVNANGVQILKPNKQPIGEHASNEPFEESTLILSEGDAIYLFTDGYADQFGGPNQKKFMYKQMRDLLENIYLQDMEQQQQILESTFENWKGSSDQVDDVCIWGVRI